MELWINWRQNSAASLTKASRHTALFLIAFYRATLAHFFGGNCRFEPSCSVYAERAFKTLTPAHALRVSAKRLCKCHPWGPYGFDPVPERKST